MSDVDALIKDVWARLPTLARATASPQDYLDQVGLDFRLYDEDPRPCRIYLEIIPDAGASRDQTTRKFEKRIISAAIAARPRVRTTGRPISYTEAKKILSSTAVGRRAIATLTNPKHWKLVSAEHGGIKWSI